ncbi:hypothetical protein Q8A73_014498 [Channa argus]|nr:hypothetical protein Q8A73_014498 [Channa argus]
MLKGEVEMVFTDGCCFRHSTEGLTAGYGVIRRTKEAEVAIVKCRGHAGDQGAVAQGTNRADEVAKQAAGYKDGDNRMMVSQEVIDLLPELTEEVIVKEQERVDPQEKSVWKQRCNTDRGIVEEGRW